LNIDQKIQLLKPHAKLLSGNLMGIEKEGLRVSRKGGLSQAPHPSALGCALTHPNITTDFSESLLELVTPPLPTAQSVLNFLKDTHIIYIAVCQRIRVFGQRVCRVLFAERPIFLLLSMVRVIAAR